VLFDFEKMSPVERYKLLLATVLPRPIAWITTHDASGLVNAAPFSFFNVFGSDPATVGVGIGSRSPGQPKDTRANIRTNEQFVVNLVPFSLAQQMRITSIAFPKGVDEPKEAGLTLTASERVAVPRISDAPVSMECTFMQEVALGESCWFMSARTRWSTRIASISMLTNLTSSAAWKAAGTRGRPNASRCRTFRWKNGGASNLRN
jgi:flavin reductase (DIM6/NTAB) family NADH-FMN oxidoreductase RutF